MSMTVIEYLDAVKERLTTDPLVAGFSIVRERVTLVDGHLRARLTISDGSQLEFSEYVQRSPDEQINVVTYSYHWADTDGNLIRRWDNTPHFPDLPGFPHHVHDGRAGSVLSGTPVSIFLVLDEIARLIT
jgi:hypothetical protein